MDIGPVGRFLQNLGLISNNPDKIVLFHKGTRDNKEINVLKCEDTNVLFLDKIAKIKPEYSDRLPPEKSVLTEDNIRRHKLIRDFVKNKAVVDVGAGSGGLCYGIKDICSNVMAVEPDNKFRVKCPVPCVAHVSDLEPNKFDVVLMMHVLEHMENSLLELKQIRTKLKTGGLAFIEVPHAMDLLIEISPAFRNHTFWSEHLVLHTKESLEKLLNAAGFSHVTITGIQRYGLSNHLNWMLNKAPNGHKTLRKLPDERYRTELQRHNRTDTLVALVRK